ncbi:hypothetical protein ACFWUW_04955 [Streptomyces sp. NPDC058655]
MTDLPLVLLDADGSLNPFRSRLAGLRGHTGQRVRPALRASRRAAELSP